jgi:hypothetical protein
MPTAHRAKSGSLPEVHSFFGGKGKASKGHPLSAGIEGILFGKKIFFCQSFTAPQPMRAATDLRTARAAVRKRSGDRDQAASFSPISALVSASP